jgi:hypothetical protein
MAPDVSPVKSSSGGGRGGISCLQWMSVASIRDPSSDPTDSGEVTMLRRSSAGLLAFAAVLVAGMSVAPAAETAKYPNWKGQWNIVLTPGLPGQRVKFDPTKPWGPGQEAPLTPEYQKVL